MDLELLKQYFHSEFTFGGVQVGGSCGEIPTVPIGSIFYMGHKIVRDPATGDFDELAAARLVEQCDALSDKLGIRYMLDVIGNTPQALVKYVSFLKKVTRAPLLVNASLPEVRLQALQEITDRGLADGVGYNSIGGFSTEAEIEALAKLPVDTSIVQAYAKGKKPDAPLMALLGDRRNESLLEKAYRAGIPNVLVDIPTLDIASIGMVPRAAAAIKSTIDLPCGTASSNATYGSGWLRNRENISKEQFHAVDASVNAYLATQKCSFVLMGPLAGFSWVFPAVAFANAYHVYGLRIDGVHPKTERHPMFEVIN